MAMEEKKQGLLRRMADCGRRLLAGLLVLALAAVPVPEAKAASAADIDGFEVWIQWGNGSSADTLNWNSVREEEKTVLLQVNYRNNEGGSSKGFPQG